MFSNKVLVLMCALVLRASGNCILSLKDDFGSPAPVFLRNGAYLAPSSSGDVRLRRGDAVVVACPGDNKSVLLGDLDIQRNDVDIHCVSNKTFRAKSPSWEGSFSDVHCNQLPWFTTELNGTCDMEGVERHRVGYKVRGKLYSLYEVCFNRILLSTVYVTHRITPASTFIQTGGGRPNFIGGEMFGKTRVSKLYKTANQKTRLAKLLGTDMENKYITKNQYLNRGHLAPRGDFSLKAEQRASFHYGNVAPQWSQGNNGDWNALEDALRRRASTGNVTLTVMTGTHGVTSLADVNGRPVDVYLDTDVNNNYVVPVPLYFYKLVYEPLSKAAVAFVTINNPYYNESTRSALTFCADECSAADGARSAQFPWLRWRRDGFTSFCCGYQQFARTIHYLPRLQVHRLFH